MGKIWAVCSGSGGVGKSTIALSLAAGAAKEGKRVVLLDASGISRSCDLLLGMESIVVFDMVDVVSRQADMEAAVYRVPGHEGLRFACASLQDSIPVAELASAMLALHSMCDILVIDLPTGQTDLGADLLREGDERIVITRPDDASIRAAERIMMRCVGESVGTSLVINRISRERVKRGYQHSQDAVQMTLDRMAIGCIPEDAAIAAAQCRGIPAIECDGPARTALRDLLKSLLGSG